PLPLYHSSAAAPPAHPPFPTRRSSDLLPEHSPFGNALVQHLGLDLVGACPPALGAFVLAPLGGDISAARGRHPAHDLGCREVLGDRKSTRLNSSHQIISYAVFCLKKKK